MTEALVRRSTPQDVERILEVGLREADRLECEAAFLSETAALQDSFELTPDCRTVVIDGEPAAMFGVAPMGDQAIRCGVIWFLGTDRISKITTRFLRESRAWLEAIEKDFDLLVNVVHQTNTLHVRWLRWLGFTFLSRRHGPFAEFVRIVSCVTPDKSGKSSTEAVSPATQRSDSSALSSSQELTSKQ